MEGFGLNYRRRQNQHSNPPPSRVEHRNSRFANPWMVQNIHTYSTKLPYVTAAQVLPGILEIREALPVTPANNSGCDAS